MSYLETGKLGGCKDQITVDLDQRGGEHRKFSMFNSGKEDVREKRPNFTDVKPCAVIKARHSRVALDHRRGLKFSNARCFDPYAKWLELGLRSLMFIFRWGTTNILRRMEPSMTAQSTSAMGGRLYCAIVC